MHKKQHKEAFQLAVQNKLPQQFSVEKQTAGKKWFEQFMRSQSKKLLMCQPTRTSLPEQKDSAEKT